MIFRNDVEKFTVFSDDGLESVIDRLSGLTPQFCIVVCRSSRDVVGVLSLGDLIKVRHFYKSSQTVMDFCNTDFVFATRKHLRPQIREMVSRYRFVPIVAEGKCVSIALGQANEREFAIGPYQIARPNDFLVIAEVGNNHNGSLDRAFELIDTAKEIGVDILKFQLRNMESFIKQSSIAQDLSSQYVNSLLVKYSFNQDQLAKCFDYCHQVGIHPICTPFDSASLDFLASYGISTLKISSSDLSNTPLIQQAIQTGLPMILSTGMSTEEDIDRAIELLEKSTTNYALLHCNSTYPPPYSDLNLAYLKNLASKNGSVIGYSGHELGHHVPIAAFCLGAQIIEKHFTIDKSLEGNDHKVSLLPSEMKQMIENLRDVSDSIGSYLRPRCITQGELLNKVALGKSVIARENIVTDEMFTENNICIGPPGSGVSPSRLNEVLGRVSMRKIAEGSPIFDFDLHEADDLGLGAVPQNFVWGIPVRYHDAQQMISVFDPPMVEFHLSAMDLELEPSNFLTKSDLAGRVIVVHAPEQFAGDFILDLFSEDVVVTKKSMKLARTIVSHALKLASISGSVEPPSIVFNFGGHSALSFLDPDTARDRIPTFSNCIDRLSASGVRLLAQTMPPFPWHFGGQGFHNQFTSVGNIKNIMSQVQSLGLCLDTSHSYMWANHASDDFFKFVEDLLPDIEHVHMSDARGTNFEGLQLGEGEIDFDKLRSILMLKKNKPSLLMEIWQGHDQNGAGFKKALNILGRMNY